MFRLKKDFVIYYDVVESIEHYTKRSDAGTGKQTLHNFTFMWTTKKQNRKDIMSTEKEREEGGQRPQRRSYVG